MSLLGISPGMLGAVFDPQIPRCTIEQRPQPQPPGLLEADSELGRVAAHT